MDMREQVPTAVLRMEVGYSSAVYLAREEAGQHPHVDHCQVTRGEELADHGEAGPESPLGYKEWV